jgi:hypothetical protein
MAELQSGVSEPHAQPSPRWQHPPVRAAGSLPTLLGGVALGGWYTCGTIVLPTSPASVLIEPNTAAGFCSPGARISSPYRSGLTQCGRGGIGVDLGGLTLLQESLLTVDLGIALSLVLSDLSVDPCSPDRMARHPARRGGLTDAAIRLKRWPGAQPSNTPSGSGQSSP